MLTYRMILQAVALVSLAGTALAQPSLVQHVPGAGVFNQPASITGREPEIVREADAVEFWIKVGPSFTYNRVNVYVTYDGTEPQGANGLPGNASTFVLSNAPQGPGSAQVFFQYNQPSPFGGNDDWWKTTVPAVGNSTVGTRAYNSRIRYKVSAQQNSGSEVFAGNGQTYEYTNKLAWPGAGAGQANPGVGYPPVSFWKEEAFIGNTYTAAMIDQNGSWWDMYFPTPGGVQGVGTRNEGYSDGGDTFPALLSAEKRGQMHLNTAMVGLRPVLSGVTHWLSNPGGVSYTNVQQSYAQDTTNTVRTTQQFNDANHNISITQYDFAPAGIDFPDGLFGTGEQKHILVKRMILRNDGSQSRDFNVYLYIDPSLNGGDSYDAMFWDAARGSMTAYDKTRRTVTGTGPFIAPPEEYNITTFPGYEKNIALYLSSAMNVVPGAHPSSGPATESWADTSGDQGQGWIGKRVTLPPNVDVEINFVLAGAHLRPDPITAPIPLADGVYDNELVPVLNWFYTSSMGAMQNTTDTHWSDWLANGVTVDTPDDDFDRLMKRGLLATALHQDGVNGGVVAGYHNGAYYYVWPRDAMWAAVTLTRAGHLDEAQLALDWMRSTTFRDTEPFFGNNPITGQPHKGFWKQKYTTDGFTVWGAPQIDGTAVYPWALAWYYDMTADTGLLSTHYAGVWDAAAAMTRDSVDSRLRFEESVNLMYTNNLWEDSYDVFIFSNANVVRGLRDSARIAGILGRPADASTFTGLSNTILNGLNARLDWNGENTDASQLGIVYPFETHLPTDARAVKVIDRINGVATDRFGNNHPLVNYAGFFNDGMGWTDLINRYWGDGYWGNGSASSPWGAGPWFLTTMWYGMYYALRQDFTPGTGDIDNHRYRLDLLIDRLGPAGLGAEQIAPRGIPGQPTPRDVGSLMYPGQNDFMLQTAWPNAWESMSFFVDSIMAFLDYQPDAATETITVQPKLPSAWPSMNFQGLKLVHTPSGRVHRVDASIAADFSSPSSDTFTHTFTNTSGFALNVNTTIRVPASAGIASVTRNGVPIAYTYDAALGAVAVSTTLDTGAGSATVIRVTTGCPADLNNDSFVDDGDFVIFAEAYELFTVPPAVAAADLNSDGFVDDTDFVIFAEAYEAFVCP